MVLTILELESLTRSKKLKIDSYIQKNSARIDQRISDLIPENTSFYRSLFDATRYSLYSNGKRIRPVLLLSTLEDLGMSWETGLDPACAVEFVHTYSLIHDDLPCMDNDDMRRGKASLHKAFDEATALLSGDFLLTFAFETITKCNLDEKTKVDLIRILSQRAGGHGMIGGQILDLGFEGKKINEKKLFLMHSNKTASLFVACMEMASVIAGIPSKAKQSLSAFALKIGLTYQLMDDLLDLTSQREIPENGESSDLVKKKSTAVQLFGIEGTKKQAQKIYQSALQNLKDLQNCFTRLKSLCSRLFQGSF